MSRTGSYRSSRSISKQKQYYNKKHEGYDKDDKKEYSSKNNGKKKSGKFSKKPNVKKNPKFAQAKKNIVDKKKKLPKEQIIFTNKQSDNNMLTIGLIVKFNIFGRLCKNSRIILTNILRKNMTFLTYNMDYFILKHKIGNLSGKDVEKFVRKLRKKDLLYGKYKNYNFKKRFKAFDTLHGDREIFATKFTFSENVYGNMIGRPIKRLKYRLSEQYQIHINLGKLLARYARYQMMRFEKYPNYVNLRTCCDYKCDHKYTKFPKGLLDEYGLISINKFENIVTINPVQIKYIVPTFYSSTVRDRLCSYRIAFNGNTDVNTKQFSRGGRISSLSNTKWYTLDHKFETDDFINHSYNSLQVCYIPVKLASSMQKRIKRIM